jgi:cation diffusion facilitator CzcD-associated flavoprotein CzcO
MIGTYNDVITDPVANESAASFIRDMITATIKDPEKARKLTPSGPWATRPVADNGYHETFNRDNVDVVALRENPIERITPHGILTADGVEHELDVIVFATGFDGVTGPFKDIDIRGRDGLALRDKWKDGASSHLAVAHHGFPNMFTVYGPYSPFANNPPLISVEVEFVAELIGHLDSAGLTRAEARLDSEHQYVASCDEVAQSTIMYSGAASWINGGNVPGKPKQLMFNMGGLVNYRKQLADEIASDYPGFELTTLSAKHATAR